MPEDAAPPTDEAEAAAPTTGPVLGIFAHPDDAEICAGATLAKWVAAGREVHLLVLTNGDRGSQDPAQSREELAAIRAEETEAAAAVLGLASVRILSTHDGDLENTVAMREAVARRSASPGGDRGRPDPTVVFLQDRYYNHSDHRNAGWIALDGLFPGSGNPHFFAEHLQEGLRVRDVHDVWLAWSNEPNHVEDVTGFLPQKVEALGCHASQLSEGIRFFDEWLKTEGAEAGAKIGVEHAEEFRVLDLS